MKKCIGLLVLVVLCIVITLSFAEDFIEITDYIIPEINLDDKPEDYYGTWKCIYACTSGKIYDYESVVDYLIKHNMTMEYEGETYPYSELGNDFFLVFEDNMTYYQIYGSLRIELPFEYTKEIAADHSGVFMLRDGKMIFQNLESDEKYIFEKQTELQLLEYALENNHTATISTDLSTMSYNELIELKDAINLAIWNSREWQEVTVPQGLWIVGKDIPAGHWQIEAIEGKSAGIRTGDTLRENGKEVAASFGRFYSASVVSPKYKYYNEGQDMTSIDYEFIDGDYVEIDYADVIFKPYIGKPSLGFK